MFFSTRERDGQVINGLDAVPAWRGTGNRPVLLVGNHQTFAPDLGFLVDEFLKQKNVCVRGLAHPVVSRDNGNGTGAMQTEDDDEEENPLEKQLREATKNTPFAQFMPESKKKSDVNVEPVSRTEVRLVAVTFLISAPCPFPGRTFTSF